MAAPRSVLKDLPFSLARAALGFRRLSDHTLRAIGLEVQPIGMASVLHALHEAGDCTVSHLVDATQVPNGTLTGLLDTLEQKRYIARIENPADGRSWIIRLTAKGAQLCAKLQRRHRAVLDIFGSVLSQAEAAELTRLLDKASAGMRAHVAAHARQTTSKRPNRISKLPRSGHARRRNGAVSPTPS